MILEGIVTTLNADHSANIATMGAVVDDRQSRCIRRMQLRPYPGTATLANLTRTGQGVFHVTDDVELIARAALDRLDAQPELLPAQGFEGWILADACRWYALRVTGIGESGPRVAVETDVAAEGRLRDFFGLNRAKHAVVEAAILASRLAWIAPDDILGEFDRLAVLVKKTGGEAERRAFAFLRDYVNQAVNGL